MIRKLLAVSVLCVTGIRAQSPAVATPDPWKPFRFLIGSWSAKTIAGKAQASGTYSFQLDLRDHILARHTSNGNCKGPADYDCQHSDLLYIYTEVPNQSPKAIYFDNEGHVIHYNVSTPAENTAVFLSDQAGPGPQFRLSYEYKDGIMTGKFQIKPPGQSDFRPYLEWSGNRQ